MPFQKHYEEKTCAICANFMASNAVVGRDKYYYYIENVMGKCRNGDTQQAVHRACPKFAPLPGFNA